MDDVQQTSEPDFTQPFQSKTGEMQQSRGQELFYLGGLNFIVADGMVSKDPHQ